MNKLTGITATLLLSGCASFMDGATHGWYRPDTSAQQFSEDQYSCMQQTQTAVANAYGSGYANEYGGSYNGGSTAYTTTNTPLFVACMQARGYVWTNRAEVKRYEAGK